MLGINAVGRRTGEAVVALESPEQADLGLKRHKHYLNRRYVEVCVIGPHQCSTGWADRQFQSVYS